MQNPGRDPLVSIIMPVYNAQAFLKEAIQSILSQTYCNFELIIINDGSWDNSEDIIFSFNDSRIRYLKQSNSGVARTLNKGIEETQGKYIWRHDADDISLPNKLQTQVEFLLNNPSVALCACQVAFMTENGKVAWDFKQPKDREFLNESYIKVIRESFNPYSPITHGTVLVKTDVMRDLGGYRTEFITGEDVDCWLRLIQHYEAVVLHQCLSLHRLSTSSATQVHGWKNAYFRNLAFKFYDQRIKEREDDIQKGKSISIPEKPYSQINTDVNNGPGRIMRNDLLDFMYPLNLNAKDYKGVSIIVSQAISNGWKLKSTWKAILFPLIGKNMVKRGVKFKRKLRW